MEFMTPQWFECLPSTNSHLASMVKSDPSLPSGFVIAAREQTAGRGRLQRSWISPPRQNLTFSFHLSRDLPREWVPSLPMACAIGVVELLRGLGVEGAVTKWPNDVLVDNQKLCGILAEMIPGQEGAPPSLVTGIGFNVNMGKNDLAMIDRPATSLLVETGQRTKPDELLPDLLASIKPWINRWSEAGFAGIRERWIETSAMIGLSVVVEGKPGEMENVTIAGFGDHGELLIQGRDQNVRQVWAADIHLFRN